MPPKVLETVGSRINESSKGCGVDIPVLAYLLWWNDRITCYFGVDFARVLEYPLWQNHGHGESTRGAESSGPATMALDKAKALSTAASGFLD